MHISRPGDHAIPYSYAGRTCMDTESHQVAIRDRYLAYLVVGYARPENYLFPKQSLDKRQKFSHYLYGKEKGKVVEIHASIGGNEVYNRLGLPAIIISNSVTLMLVVVICLSSTESPYVFPTASSIAFPTPSLCEPSSSSYSTTNNTHGYRHTLRPSHDNCYTIIFTLVYIPHVYGNTFKARRIT